MRPCYLCCIKYIMTVALKRAIAAAELLLIFPAALFMTSLFVRNLQPQELEPARTAVHIVDWYAARTHVGLWLFLIAFPVAVLACGCAMLVQSWRAEVELRDAVQRTLTALRPHVTTLMVAAATLAAGVILAIVALHVMSD